jgi:hypothetical protein
VPVCGLGGPQPEASLVHRRKGGWGPSLAAGPVQLTRRASLSQGDGIGGGCQDAAHQTAHHSMAWIDAAAYGTPRSFRWPLLASSADILRNDSCPPLGRRRRSLERYFSLPVALGESPRSTARLINWKTNNQFLYS